MTPASSVASDAEQQWHQYRHNETNNAVLTSPVDEIYAGVLTTENEVRATPTIVGRTMFVGNHDSGDLQAYDLQSGEQLWHNQAPNWVHSELIYVDGVIIVGFGNRFFDGDIRGTGESGVLGLDAESGEELWRFETEGQVMPTPAKANGAVHIVTGDHHHYELDPDTGEELSRTDVGHVVSMSSPGSNGDLLFFGGGHPAPFAFTALDPHSSEIAWQIEFPDVISGLDDVPPAISGDTVVTSANIAGPQSPSGDEDEILDTHMLYALDTATGSLLWETALGDGERPTNNRSGAPTIDDGTIFVGSPTTGWTYAYELASGDELWKYRTGTVKGAPVVKDGVVYVGTAQGWVHALDSTSGEKVGERHFGGTLAPSGPIIVNDTLVVGSQDSNVYLSPLDEIIFADSSTSQGIPWLPGITILLAAITIVLVAALVVQDRRLHRRSDARARHGR